MTTKDRIQFATIILDLAKKIESADKELDMLKSNPPNYYKTFGSEDELRSEIQKKEDEITKLELHYDWYINGNG